jgi:hypothetical protein
MSDSEPTTPIYDDVETPVVKGKKPVKLTNSNKTAEAKAEPKAEPKARRAKAAVLDSDDDEPKPARKPKAKAAEDAPKAPRGVSDDTKKYLAALDKIRESGMVIFEELTTRTMHQKLNSLLIKWIIEEINNHKAAELHNDADPYNPYPAASWATAEVKVAGKVVNQGKAAKHRTRPGIPLEDDIEVSQSDDEPAESADKPAGEAKIKNIVIGNYGCRNSLAFIMIRFIHEINYTKSLEDVEDAAGFKNFVFTQVSGASQLSRVIICTVDRLRSSVKKMSLFDYNDIGSIFAKQTFAEYKTKKQNIAPRPGMARYAAEYLMYYYQLIAKFLAAELWVKHKSINAVAVEQAMRCLNIGNDTQGHGFEAKDNVLHDMRKFDACISPQPPKVPKAPKAKAKSAKKAAE